MFKPIACALLCAALGLASAQTLPVGALPADTPKPRIDGRLDDAAWAAAPAFTAFRRYRPDTQTELGDYRSEVRVLVEPGALVFAIRAWDPRPGEIRAPLSRRDQVWPDQDSVTVWIDAAGRGEHAQFLRVNAAGSLSDGLYSAADDEEDSAPDFLDVEVAARQLADGYAVEMRWPLANLRYPLDGDRPWGLMITRRVPRDLPYSYSSAPLDREQAHLLTRLQRLSDETLLRDMLHQARHLSLRAEGTLRHQARRGSSANLGLELQWRPRADLFVDAIWRPDFSQVELDEPQLAGNTRFALFVPEKRAFFLESSDVVGQVPPDDWGVSRGLLAFYSRSVTAPRWGLRATQRGSEREGTVLALRDAGGGLLLRADAFGTRSSPIDRPSALLFARQGQRLGDQLALAGLLSLRDWGGGASTRVAGMDARWQPSDSWQWRGHALLSEDRTAVDDEGGLRTAPARRAAALWASARWRDGDWRLLVDAERIAPGFVNDNGFVPQAGIRRLSADLLHAFHPEGSRIAVWEALLRAVDSRALRDPARGLLREQTVSQALQPGFWLLGPGSTELFAHWNLERQRSRAEGRLHAPRSVLIGVDSHPGARLSYLHLEATVGERVHQELDRVGRGIALSTQLSWRQPLPGGRHLEFEQRFGGGRVQAPGGAAALDERQAQTKLILHLSREQAIRLLWQWQRLRRVAEPGLVDALRERSRTGTLTWLAREGALKGWSLGASWSRDDGEAVRRELFLKYQTGWAWH